MTQFTLISSSLGQIYSHVSSFHWVNG